MTKADRHRADAARLRREAESRRSESFFGSEIWLKLAAFHEEVASKLDEVTSTQSDLPVIEG